MSARAAIVVTGTEVLTGRVADANGPWLAEELRRLGVDVGTVVVVGDRADDLADALRFLRTRHDLLITTGGLGPTADDLTAQVVAAVQGRAMRVDAELERRIAAVVTELVARRGWATPEDDLAAGTRKQATVPEAAHVLEPTGTAPGLVVPAADGPPVVVLPGPPGELRAMWPAAVADDLVMAAIPGGDELRQSTMRLWGPPEAELAGLLREAGDLPGLEVTTCLRDGELEVVTRFVPDHQPAYDDLATRVADRFGAALYSPDGRTVEEIVADLLRDAGATLATGESCTAGLLAARLADRPGSSDYLLGGAVTYSNRAKTEQLGVPADLIDRVGAVSEEVAVALAHGARERFGSTVGIGVTGVAGPGGGTAEKPVGLVHVCVATRDRVVPRRLMLPGSRSQVRARSVTTCLHLLREVLEADRASEVEPA